MLCTRMLQELTVYEYGRIFLLSQFMNTLKDAATYGNFCYVRKNGCTEAEIIVPLPVPGETAIESLGCLRRSCKAYKRVLDVHQAVPLLVTAHD